MTWHRLRQASGWAIGGTLVLLVVLYVTTSHSTVSQPQVTGPTPYPSIVLYPTLVPTPGPDMQPHVVDLLSGHLQPVPIPANTEIEAALSDGTLLIADGPQGPATVVGTDGASLAALPVPDFVPFLLSTGHSYVAWIAGNHFEVYDAQGKQISSAPPTGARFDGGFRDGSIIMDDVAGAWPASPPSVTGGRPAVETVIVDRSGGVTDRLPAPKSSVAVSPDDGRIAWVDGGGLHVYDRSTHADRVYSNVTAVTGNIAWSPDGAEVAYVRFTGDNALFVWVVDVTSGAQHRVYSAETDARVRKLAFVANHELQLETEGHSSLSVQEDLPGTRYAVADDGTGGHYLDDPAAPWSTCGPSCGMPPVGYEDADGFARWCAQSPDGGCISHVVLVDRGASKMREVASGAFVEWSLSPDRRQVAILLPSGTDQLLRIVQLDDFSSRDVSLGFTFANFVTWLPGGQSLLLWRAGGN